MGLTYDDAGRVTAITGTGASTFLYDGDGVALETNGANATTLYRLPGVDFVRNGAQRYEQESSLGSLLTSRDASGAVTGATEYDAYGREVYAVGTDRGSYRFARAKGYVNDDATGMQLLGARYYLPALGRFLTQDPIGHEGGLNLYAYCENSPLTATDASGNGPDWDSMSNKDGVLRAAPVTPIVIVEPVPVASRRFTAPRPRDTHDGSRLTGPVGCRGQMARPSSAFALRRRRGPRPGRSLYWGSRTLA